MDAIFKKLNFKDQKTVLLINAPESFLPNVAAMAGLTRFIHDPAEARELEFAILFVTRQQDIDTIVPDIAPRLKGDAIVWFVYPKGTSKKYTCDFNRDTGWAILGKYGLEPVRQVAVDEDWSALRFRKVEFIKTITRRTSMALSEEARKRTTHKGKP